MSSSYISTFLQNSVAKVGWKALQQAVVRRGVWAHNNSAAIALSNYSTVYILSIRSRIFTTTIIELIIDQDCKII